MMTKTDFEAVALTFADVLDSQNLPSASPEFIRGGLWATETLAESLADVFLSSNPRFDRDKFLTACGLS